MLMAMFITAFSDAYATRLQFEDMPRCLSLTPPRYAMPLRFDYC